MFEQTSSDWTSIGHQRKLFKGETLFNGSCLAGFGLPA